MTFSASSGERGTHLRGTLIVAAGVLILSPDALLVRLVEAPTLDIVFWRTALLALSLAGFLVLRYRRRLLDVVRVMGWAGIASAVLFAFNSVFFVAAITHTRIANALAILSTAPFFASIFGRVFLRERVPPRTWIAIPVACGGIGLIFGGSLLREPSIVGELFALAVAVTLGANLVILRGARAIDMVPAVCLGGALAAVLVLPFTAPLTLRALDYGILAVMGGVQIPVAFVMIAAIGTRYLPAPEVGLLMIGEVVLGPLLGWIALGERPGPVALVGVVIVIATLVVHGVLGVRESRPPPT